MQNNLEVLMENVANNENEGNYYDEELPKNKDYSADFENYKKSMDEKISDLLNKIEALKNSKNEENQALTQDDLLKKIEALEKQNQQRLEYDEMSKKYAQTELELRKAHPDVDMAEVAKVGEQLTGLANGDKNSWNVLINLIKNQIKKSPKQASTVESNNHRLNRSDFDMQKRISEDDAYLGEQLLSLI
ncbi:hypothetical protein AB9T38_05920 [Campylobacter hepaticus]